MDLMGQVFNTPISQQELNAIDSVFPEYGGVDASLLNPSHGLNLFFYQQASVTFTFISEGAGYKNKVGYFLYDDYGNILSRQTVFSNASGTGPGLAGGGLLNPGDSVVLGLFDEGTHLGFWIQANGYNNPNSHIYYTLEDRNPDNKGHFALWLNPDSQRLVYGVEDLFNLGDHDYNDLVFSLSVDPLEATNQGGDSAGAAAPEPGTMLLLASGLAGVAGLSWRRRRRRA